MKLALSRPWRKRSAIHSLSLISVLCPGMHKLGIDQHDLITAFQQIENGTPIDARAFEGHLFHLPFCEPVVKLVFAH